VVLIHTDEGVTGIGESDVNPWMAKAAILAPGTHTMSLCIRDMLIGADPFDIARRLCGRAIWGFARSRPRCC